MFKPILGTAARALSIMALLSAQSASAAGNDSALIVTASNGPANSLMFYTPTGRLVKAIPTDGQGGAGGNSGGIAADHGRIAVVNFGSGNVSIFASGGEGSPMRLVQLVQALASPVSVAFGNGHLYILSTTHVESHPVWGNHVAGVDGSAPLLLRDGSAAQVGVIGPQLILTEKGGDIETVNLGGQGAIRGSATAVSNGTSLAAPFGLVTRGNEAYVTVAHANAVSLVRNNKVLASAVVGSQLAACWAALDGPFLFVSNTASKTVSRFAVYGQHFVLDAEVAATLTGGVTDIDYRHGLAAVVDSDATANVSHVSIFKVDEDGNLTPNGSVTLNSSATNGVLVLNEESGD